MGTCCTRIYYFNLEEDELFTGNQELKKIPKYTEDEFDDKMYTQRPTSNNFSSFNINNTVNPISVRFLFYFKEKSNENIFGQGLAIPYVKYYNN